MGIFDVDRTLTGKQGSFPECPGTSEVLGVADTAYGGGRMVLSQFALNLHHTFCNQCFRGVVSAGPVGGVGSPEQLKLLEVLGGHAWTLADVWSNANDVRSPLVTGKPDGSKHEAVRDIVDWLRAHRGVDIADNHVHFFDDNIKNPPSFVGSGFNARGVSCNSRDPAIGDGAIGKCGAVESEITLDPGVVPCP